MCCAYSRLLQIQDQASFLFMVFSWCGICHPAVTAEDWVQGDKTALCVQLRCSAHNLWTQAETPLTFFLAENTFTCDVIWKSTFLLLTQLYQTIDIGNENLRTPAPCLSSDLPSSCYCLSMFKLCPLTRLESGLDACCITQLVLAAAVLSWEAKCKSGHLPVSEFPWLAIPLAPGWQKSGCEPTSCQI